MQLTLMSVWATQRQIDYCLAHILEVTNVHTHQQRGVRRMKVDMRGAKPLSTARPPPSHCI